VGNDESIGIEKGKWPDNSIVLDKHQKNMNRRGAHLSWWYMNDSFILSIEFKSYPARRNDNVRKYCFSRVLINKKQKSPKYTLTQTQKKW